MRVTCVARRKPEFALLSFAANLRLVAPHLLDETLGVLAPDEHLERVAERESGERAPSTTA
jgi:hypothetical protein